MSATDDALRAAAVERLAQKIARLGDDALVHFEQQADLLLKMSGHVHEPAPRERAIEWARRFVGLDPQQQQAITVVIAQFELLNKETASDTPPPAPNRKVRKPR